MPTVLTNLILAASGETGTVPDVVTTTTSSLDKVLQGVTDVVGFSGKMLDTMLDNPIYLFLFASSLVGVGVSIFLTFKHAARG